MTGAELQCEPNEQRVAPPIGLITGHGDAMVRPRLLEQGAVERLFKPLGETGVLAAIEAAAGRS